MTKPMLWALCILLGLAASARAQAPSSYTFRVYFQGAATPVQAPAVLQATDFVCNQAPLAITGGTQANPTRMMIDDPANAGKACVWTDPGTGVLFALPFGPSVYESTMAVTNTAGTSPESARSNLFTHPGVPLPAPTGLKVAH